MTIDQSNPAIPQSNYPITRLPNYQISGFTLIELLVVLSIMVILASIGLAQYRNSIVRANEAVLKEDLFRMRDAIDQYYADKMQYPGSLDALVSDGYMRRVPDDPFTMSATTWQTIPSEPDATNPNAAPRISTDPAHAPSPQRHTATAAADPAHRNASTGGAG